MSQIQNTSPISPSRRWNLRILAILTVGIAIWWGAMSMGLVVKEIASSAEEGETLNFDGKDGNGALGTILTGLGYFLFSVTMAIGGLGLFFQKPWSATLLRVISVLVGLVSVFALIFGVGVTIAGYDPDGNGEGIRILVSAILLLIYSVWAWLSLRRRKLVV
jgi:hypothetical protein